MVMNEQSVLRWSTHFEPHHQNQFSMILRTSVIFFFFLVEASVIILLYQGIESVYSKLSDWLKYILRLTNSNVIMNFQKYKIT